MISKDLVIHWIHEFNFWLMIKQDAIQAHDHYTLLLAEQGIERAIKNADIYFRGCK